MIEIKEHIDGILPGGIVLVSYGQYSLGWKIGIDLLKKEVENGAFGLIANFTVPFRKLVYRAFSIGLDLVEYGKNKKVVVINGFKEPVPEYEFVYPLLDVDEETFSPKYGMIMREISTKYKLRDKKTVSVFATLDSLYEDFGESFVKNMVCGYMGHAEKLVQEGRDFYTIMIVNRDVIPKRLHSWLVGVSDYVILTKGFLEKNEFYENIVVLKTIKEDFAPVVFQIKALTIPTSFLQER